MTMVIMMMMMVDRCDDDGTDDGGGYDEATPIANYVVVNFLRAGRKWGGRRHSPLGGS